ncbi:MAG: LysE family transporter [Synergistaceae bacterium]|nr:LysE family transporter [Synergistaceae bacterium]
MLEVILSYMPYALVSTSTPGPNNLMCLYSVSSGGWAGGLRLISGIFTGCTSLMLLVLFFCHQLNQYVPEVVNYLKYVGAAYIVWLAIRIAISKPGANQTRDINFKSGLILAFTNIKMLLYFITIFTAYIIPSGAGLYEFFVHGTIILSISAANWFIWGAAGSLLHKIITRYYRPFNISMGIILLWCAVRIVMS